MRSSATVACRAAVMVVCLIAIPLAAVFGTRLPDLVKQLLNRRWDLAPLLAKDSPPEAPAFGASVQAAPQDGRSDLSIWGGMPTGSQVASIGLGGPLGTTGSVGDTSNARQMDTIWANYDSPVEPAPEPSLPNLVPVAQTDQAQTSAGPTGPFLSPNPPRSCTARTPQSAQATEQFAYIQRRLRELGATYYRLETWGAQGQLYRFQARMAAGGGGDYVRHFEATDTDPLAAMATLLDQVETWRAGR